MTTPASSGAAVSAPFVDHFGTPIRVGDTIQVDVIDRGRGAEMWMHRGEVVGFAKTRVIVQFSAYQGTRNVGAECMVVVPS